MIDKIVCVGKNYLEHAKELGDAVPAAPVLFLKPASVLKQASRLNDMIHCQFPENRGDVHFECEVVLRVSHDGRSFDAVTLGLDLTLRTLQASLKKNGHPWTISKVFPDAAVIGPWIPLTEFPQFMETPFSLTIDNELRQQATLAEAMMGPHELLAYIRTYFNLCAGDLIFTGTPSGVGKLSLHHKARLHWGPCQYGVMWSLHQK